MHVTPETVAAEHEWVVGRTDEIAALINEVRGALGEAFETRVDPVDATAVREAADALFADGDRAVNAAALIGLLRDLDVDEDYPGFVVDEYLGRLLAGTIAGDEPLRLLGEATFHFADVMTDRADAPAGMDDLEAALAAGFQTRLPGWSWRAGPSPFSSP